MPDASTATLPVIEGAPATLTQPRPSLTCRLQCLGHVQQRLVHVVQPVTRLLKRALRVVDWLTVVRRNQEPAQRQGVVFGNDLEDRTAWQTAEFACAQL